MELLIQLVDVTDSNFYYNCGLPKTGDVVDAHNYTGTWGPYFEANPYWQILPVNLTEADVALYTQMEVSTGTLPSNTLQFRDRCLDVTRLSGGMTLSDLIAITTMKSPIADPAILGGG